MRFGGFGFDRQFGLGPKNKTLEPTAVSGISFVGSKTFTHTSGTPQACDLTDLKDENNETATLAENDVVFTFIAISSSGETDPGAGIAVPTGYTALHTYQFADDLYEIYAQASAKVMGSTPDSSVTIPATFDADANTTGVAVVVFALRGVDTSNINDVDAVASSGINGANPNCGAITPVTPGAWIFAFGAAGLGTLPAFTKPANLSSVTNHFKAVVVDESTDAGVGVGLYTDWTSGAFDPDAFGGGDTSSFGAKAQITLAIRPAS